MRRRIRFESWRTTDHFEAGAHEGTVVGDGALALASPSTTREYDDPHRDGPPMTYEQATWTSPEVSTGFPFTELVASWNACTPEGTWIEVALRVNPTQDPTTPWYVMARWAETDHDIAPTSVPGQSNDRAQVNVDRLTLAEEGAGSTYQLRVSLLRRSGSTATPAVSLLGCVASDVHAGELPASPERNGAAGTVLDVPTYSQRLHVGEYPQWAGGGESWCSPTSTSMVLSHWGCGPSASDYTWVDPGLPDRFVPYAARHTYDHAYGAPGNWSFNAAYAARFGATAFVTRLRSLAEAEHFINAGIPLVVGVAFTREQLEGAGYATAGHLAVVAGFDENGDVVCNDPASHEVASNDEVRATFDREQFERAWMRSAGGITYVIRPPGVPLPQAPAEANW
ncbi:MAG TPA: C39 family peptidase [Nocardioidaceae bacterium]|nr:C39 family peptidase [Nocardioidaceae bacterium]